MPPSWSSLELHRERSGVVDTQSALAGKGIRNPVPEAAPGGGGPQLLSLMLPQGACVVLAARCGTGLQLGPLVLAVQGRGQSSSLPPALLPFSAFLIFFPLCPARVSFAGSAAPWYMQSFAHLSGQALSTCRGIEGKVDTICNSFCASFRDASGVYGSCQPVSQPQGSWILESGSERLNLVVEKAQ